MWGTGADGGSLLKCNFEKFSFRFVFQFPNFRWIESHPILSKDEANEDVSIAQWRKVKQMQSMHCNVTLHLPVQAIWGDIQKHTGKNATNVLPYIEQGWGKWGCFNCTKEKSQTNATNALQCDFTSSSAGHLRGHSKTHWKKCNQCLTLYWARTRQVRMLAITPRIHTPVRL